MPLTRITAGALKGRVVSSPKGQSLRPTTSLVRKALFDILGAAVVDAVVVDLYAGTGAIGFEALSRGAARAIFIERERAQLQLIAETAARFEVADRCQRVAADALAWIRRAGEQVRSVDLVFVDPPYQDESVDAVLAALGNVPPRLVVCEHHRARRLPELLGGLTQVRQATYGTTRLTFWRGEVGSQQA